jgi:hypothetical protein
MALKDPKILIGAAALAAWLFSSNAKASSKGLSSNSAGTNGSLGGGDEGQAAGPNGCKPGLINKDGICIKPSTDNNSGKGNQDSNSNTGTGGYSPSASSLTISNKCDNFTFGDKTGNAWWLKNKPVAQQWIKNGYDNPIQIAYGMLKKNKEACFKDFPDYFDDPNVESGEPEFQLLKWIRKYPKIWELIWWLRTKIDDAFFLGRQTVTIDPKTFKYTYGKEFKFDILWDESLMNLSSILLNLEMNSPGILLNNEKETNMYGLINSNVATYLYHILFPNIDFNILMSRYNKGILDDDPIWSKMWDYTSDQDALEYDFDTQNYNN